MNIYSDQMNMLITSGHITHADVVSGNEPSTHRCLDVDSDVSFL